MSDPIDGEISKHRYATGKNCPDCGKPEITYFLTQYEAGYGYRHYFSHSCQHHRRRIDESPCRFCGKKDTPVRQIPCPLPVSDCYCDDCVEACREAYGFGKDVRNG